MELDVEVMVGRLGESLLLQGAHMATAESCTGGLLASTLTDVAGSSRWFEGGVVAYDNCVKMRLLGVPEEILIRHGAVSQACVESMVKGVCELMKVPVALAISGIAGPGGGTPEKPVGLVWMAWRINQRIWSREFRFQGSRREIKQASVREAVLGLL
ncbi:MAG: damage-inducible protein CinA [Deltaproteobacteria bacterium HGW-Deltaproteobacteria-18]|nr:MAG: damage-inducible protein CinA [Deltaproteobacteria bacterium HGW-Deltaproteobacteria-18]